MLRVFQVIACFTLIILLGCSRKIQPVTEYGSIDNTNGNIKVNGSWELRSFYGGNRAGNGGESQPGNGNVYTFTDKHYEHYEDQKLADSGMYTITKSRGPENGDPLDAFAFNGTDTVLFILNRDTLTLQPRAPMYDGVARKYVRVYLH